MKILDEIIEVKRGEVAELRRKYSRSSFGDFSHFHGSTRHFTEKLLTDGAGIPPAIIAEIKRSSPSAGALRTITDPGRVAADYQSHGARAVSVLTDGRFFGGSGADLTTVRLGVDLPLLRKDFIIDEYQVLESRAIGADAVLLIASILDASALSDLRSLADELGLDTLVEVHDPTDLNKIDYRPETLIGINNRNLAEMTVSPATTTRIAALLPPGVPFVSESGLHSPADVRLVLAAGASAVLMGEYFMKSAHPGEALEKLLDELRQD